MEKIIFVCFILGVSGCAYKSENLFRSNQDIHLKSHSYFESPSAIHEIPANAAVYWLKVPSVPISGEELEGKDRIVIVSLKADEKGYITSASIKKSSGLKELDEKCLDSLKLARLRPHKVNGQYLRFDVDLPFVFSLVKSSN